jgi:hypothetical protein
MMQRVFVAAALVAAAGSVASAQDGQFNVGNLVVSSVESSASLTNAATSAFLREFTVGGALTGDFVSFNSGSTGRRLTNSGTATSEGALALSPGGRFLSYQGYDAAAGTASIVGTTSAAVNRVVGVVDITTLGADLSTALTDAYSGNNLRSSVYNDATGQIFTGGNATTTGGVRETTLGGTTTTARSTNLANVRVVNLFNGQVYFSAASGTFQGIGVIDLATNTASLLPGFPTSSGPSAYDFVFTDANTLYVADDRLASSGGGLQKWTFNGTTWSLQYTMNTGLTNGLRGLTFDPTTGTFYAIDAATSPRLVSVVDSGVGSTFTILATSPANTAFRGVEFIIPTPGTAALMGLGSIMAFRRRRA